MADIEKSYEPLRKRHNLPPFKEIDEEFEISTIESDKFLLREIRKKIYEKIEDAGHILEDILQPDANISVMYEARVFDDDEKKDIFNLYRKMMYWKRMFNEAYVANSEQMDAELINTVFSSWKDIKKEMSSLIRKLRDSWLEDVDTKTDLPYFG